MKLVGKGLRARDLPDGFGLTLTPRESQQLTRFGLNHTYALLRAGQMPSIKTGKRFFIPKAALLKWLENAGRNEQ